MGDLVSIIIPVFNSEKTLTYCLESILNQTYNNLEIILIDDGSEDRSLVICNEFKEKDKRVIVIHKENEGVSIARNIGIKHSKGKYIAFVDSDDIISNDMIEILINDIIRNDCDLSSCGIKKIFDYNEKLVNIPNKYSSIKFEKDQFLNLVLNENIGGFLCNKLYKSSIIRDNNISLKENIYVCEDLLFNIEYILKSNNFCYNSNVLYGYIQHSNGSFYKQNNLRWFTIFDSYLMIIELLKKENVSASLLEEVYYQLCYISCEAIAKNKHNTQKYDGIKTINEYVKNNYLKVLLYKHITFKQKVKLTIYKFFPIFVYKYKLNRVLRSQV